MASLNTLRTKFGIVLSIVIAGALLAFILSLKTEMGFSGNDPRVGVINGKKINYSEYYNQYEQIKAQSGAQESDEQQSAMLANAAWQALIGKYVLEPGFDKMGLRVTEPERLSMVSGQHPSQAFYNAFADPRTGEYNVAAVGQFLAQAETNAQAQQAWAQLNEQARMEREIAKYLGLIKGGVYVNALEVANGVNAANNTYSGKWAGKKYSAVPDSLIQVKSGDIKAYYNSHKDMFKQTPSRTLSYVVFEVTPTDDDMLALEKSVAEVGAQFAATEELKSFVRANRNGKIADTYVSAAQLSEDEAKALLAGETYGPVLKNNQWTMARVLDSKMVPDTLGIRHIVLPYTQEALADSLLTVIKGGADFAQLASQYSVYEATAANGGEVGVVPFSAFTGEFVAALANAKRGDVVKVASGDAIQLMQVYRADKPSKHMRLATITYPVEASSATRRNVHSQASLFSVEGKGSVDAFNEAANKGNLTPREAKLTQGDRLLQGLADSRELVRWAYDAKVGAISEIFPVGDDYVVAVVTEIDNEDYTPIEKVANNIRQTLITDKKFEKIVSEMKGSTIEEVAQNLGTEVVPFEDVRYGSFFIRNMGVEPRVIGAITATEQTNTLSEPVKGNVGAYVFVVTDIQEAETPQSIEAEKVRAEASSQGMIQRRLFDFLEQMSNVEDLRGKYF